MNKSFTYYVLRFVGSLIGITALLYGGSFLLAEFAPDIAEMVFSGPFSIGILIAVMIVPPMQLATTFHTYEARHMRRGEGWGLAVICAALFTGVLLAGTYFVLSNRSGALEELQREIGGDLVVAALPMVIFAVVLALIYRLFFWAGVRGQIKQAARRASKS